MPAGAWQISPGANNNALASGCGTGKRAILREKDRNKGTHIYNGGTP